MRNGILGIYMEEQQNSVTVAFKHFGKRAKPYATALDFVTENVVEDGIRKAYIDADGNEVIITEEITFHTSPNRRTER
ncbi:MAG: hypothetical protein HY365_01165 [Candidatus Aenigmarchaeota archaeon]|nr:hypothetical protein [Candidatus Aenigmarchaeota archaeon]